MPHKSRAPSDGTGQLSLRLYLCVKLPGGIPTTTELLAVQITHTIFRICCNGSGKTITLLFIWQQAQDARLAEHGKVQVESTLRDTRLTLGSPWPSGLLLNISIVTISNHFSKQFCTHQKVCLFFFFVDCGQMFCSNSYKMPTLGVTASSISRRCGQCCFAKNLRVAQIHTATTATMCCQSSEYECKIFLTSSWPSGSCQMRH